jgi:hypothetical protein
MFLIDAVIAVIAVITVIAILAVLAILAVIDVFEKIHFLQDYIYINHETFHVYLTK